LPALNLNKIYTLDHQKKEKEIIQPISECCKWLESLQFFVVVIVWWSMHWRWQTTYRCHKFTFNKGVQCCIPLQPALDGCIQRGIS